MKAFIFATILSSFQFLSFATPKVSNVRIVNSSDSPRIAVAYKLDADAVVTVRFLLDGNPVSAGHSVWVGGDVNAKVSATSGDAERVLYWAPDKEEWGEGGIPALNNLTAVVTAWSLDAPPDYLVADLKAQNCVRYYASAEALPGGVSNEVYKTSKMVFRKIPAKNVVWKMGLGNGAAYRPYRKNKLTEDFYLGVYAVTRRQSQLFCGRLNDANPAWSLLADSSRCPVSGLTYEKLLGSSDAFEPSDVSDIGKFRALTGLKRATLPTEAQWEYACRSTSDGPAYWGSTITPEKTGKYAWVSNNLSDDEKRPHEVGLLLPNAYGLYDMLGNVCECCLDYANSLSEDTVNTAVDFVDKTVSSSGKRITRGSCYNYDIWNARISYYFPGGLSGGYDCGYRLALPVGVQ